MPVPSLEALRGVLPLRQAPAQVGQRARPRGDQFLKGPVPMPWLQRAMSLPGQALHVGIMLWFYAGMTRSRHVSISMSGFSKRGKTRFSASRGLAALEQAGLIRVTRAPGRKPRVEILTVRSAPTGSDHVATAACAMERP